jgi:UDP-N-acetylmuramoyl-L-alanyl-D-glutamate--2,6-diaminopimelate ligase
MEIELLIGDDAALPEMLRGVGITGLAADSRKVAPGFLFAALPGTKTDGARFIPDALAAGAAAILVGRDVAVDGTVPAIRADNPHRVFARAAARFEGRQPETVVAVTGTSGKTSVATFLRQIFTFAGKQAASLGTIGVTSPSGQRPAALTTPDPVSLHALLRELAEEGVTHAALEASSHGLDQYRLDGVRFAAGGFTNIGRDHMDYHPTPEDYFRAKLRLFTELLPDGSAAVVDADRPESTRVADAARARGLRLLTVGRAGEALRLLNAEAEGFRQRLRIDAGGGARDVLLPLAGAFQVSNALVAAGLAIGTGIDADTSLAALERLEGARGRLELAGRTAAGALIFVDYAHKPEAVATALGALRPFTRGRLAIVLGAGGDRDRGKRPLMGRAATQNADVVYVTDDNPRSEDPAAIRAEIMTAAPDAIEIGDRAEAIATAVAALGADDVLLVAGKGHETGQTIGERVLPFSDHETIAKALAGEAVP